MRYYFLILGIISILYYFVLVFYSRRFRSTFAAFWLINGGVHLLLGCAPLPVLVYDFLTLICAAGWIIFFTVESRIISGMLRRPDRKVDYVIVLGAQVRGTHITDSLKRRLDRTVSYVRSFPETKVIVSGGQGSGESITEAQAMADYLIRSGIERERIYQEGKSTSTRENLRFSLKFLDGEKDRTGIVTNDFHIYRASVIARQEGYLNIIMLPADSNPVFQLNYMVREFFAVLYVWFTGKKENQ